MSAQTITSRSRIWLKSAGETDKDVRLLVSSSFSNDWDNTWDATPAQAGGIYVYYQGAKYSIWASNEYSQNLALAFDANDNTEYTLSFASFLGEEYTITDLANNNYVITVNANTQDYVFSITGDERNSTIADRFVINYQAAPTYPAQVTTNDKGLATFSHASIDLAMVESGVKLYKGAISGDVLNLTQVDYVPAGQGVIVYGEANTTYHLNYGDGGADFTDNELKAAGAWLGAGYVLSGNLLYVYEGADFPENKAFLEIPSSGAPRRIRLAFDNATAIDNVEAEAVNAEKFIENGQIFIRRGNEVFNLQGQIVK